MGHILIWTGCIAAPAAYFLNDLAALPRGAFGGDTDVRPCSLGGRPQGATGATAGRRATGFVVHWSSNTGWARIADSDGSFPNGIDASADGRTLYFAETYGHRVNAIGLDGRNRRRISVAMQPDNVTVSPDGSVVVAGGTGAPMTSTAGCAAFRPQGCGFASALERLDIARGSVTRLFADDGSKMSGASVGVVEKSGRLIAGTSFGDRVTVVPLKP